MARKLTVTVGSGRLDHPSGVFRLERRTMGEDFLDNRDTSSSTYQALIAEEGEADGKRGLLIDIATIHNEARYYLTMKEAKLLSDIARTKGAEPEIWQKLGRAQEPVTKTRRKRGGPSNG